jgi:hypothetical protein
MQGSWEYVRELGEIGVVWAIVPRLRRFGYKEIARP